MTTIAAQVPEGPRSPRPPRKSRWLRRALVVVIKAFGLTLVFVFATAGGVLLHLGLRAPRELARVHLNDLLASTFKGKIILHRVGEVRLNGVSDVDAELLDPEGNRALFVRGVDARLGTLALLRSIFTDQLDIGLRHVHIESAEVVLLERGAGELGLARAFEPAEPSGESDTASTTRVEVDEISIGHAWVHGAVGGVDSIDVDVDDLSGSVEVTTETDVLVQVARARVEGRSLQGIPLRGDLSGSLGLPHDRRLFDATLRFDGTAGAATLNVDASIDDERVDGLITLDAPSVESFRALLPEALLLRGPIHGRVEAHGPLSRVVVEVDARVGAASALVVGFVEVPDESESTWTAAARVSASGIDLAELVRDAPRSDFNAMLAAGATFTDGGKIGGRFSLALQPGSVDGQRIPGASIGGSFTERSAEGSGLVDEPGAPTRVAFSIQPRPGETDPQRITFTTQTAVRDLRRVERVGAIGSGRVAVTTSGTFDLETQQLDAVALAQIASAHVSGVALGTAQIRATAKGPLDQLKLAADVRGSGLQVAGYTFDRVGVTASGTPEDLDLSTNLAGSGSTPTIGARAHLALSDGELTVSGGRVEIERGETKVVATVPWVSVHGDVVSARGVSVEGLGEPIHVALDKRGASVALRASAPNVDLARVKDLLAREEDILGHLSFEIDVRLDPTGGHGTVHLDAIAVQFGQPIPATAHLDAKIDGRSIDGTVDLDVPTVGTAKIILDSVTPGGSLTDIAAWTRASGRADVTGSLDLQKLSDLLPDSARATVGSATGELRINGTVSRAEGDRLPSVVLQIATNKLSTRGPELRDNLSKGTLTAGPTPWRLDGVDVIVGGTLDGATGRVDVKALVRDKSGDVAFADVSTEDVTALFAGARALTTTPFDAHVEVAPMPIDRLPLPGGSVPVVGDVAFTADFQGTLEKPRFAVHLEGTDVRARSSRTCDRALKIQADASYDGARAEVAIIAKAGGREVLNAEASGAIDSGALGGGELLAWDASGKIALKSFPLDALNGLTGTRFSGEISGEATLDGLHRDARLEAHFQGKDVEVDRGRIPDASVDATVAGGQIVATAKLTQVDGTLEARATGAMSWGAELAPTVDVARNVEVKLDAKNFGLKAFAPFLEGIVSDLDGRLDADATFHVREGGKDGDFDGSLVLRDGVFDVPQIGERFHDVKAKIVMHPWGTVRLEDFSASAPTGKVTGAATMVLDGISLESADAKVHIATGESIPIVVEGVPFGRAYGEISAKIRSSEEGKRIDVALNIPTLQVQLPQSIGHSVQPLEPHEDVRIGFHEDGQFIAVALVKPKERREPDASKIVMQIDLGDEIQIKRDTTLDVVIQGQAKVEIDGETKVTGQIRLTRGKLELEGRIFTVDRGQVSFTGGDPSNPYIQATAHWDSPTKTRVYAEFSGTPTSGKLSLRSEPALSQDEILSLVLTGTSNGQIGASAPPGQDGGAGVQAVGLAGGVVTEGLNKILSGWTSRLSTRIDSSDANNPQPQIVVQLTKSISASLGYKLGVPAPGDNPDRAELTVDWRFIKNWSLTAAVGDQGSTALDVEWRYHY